MPAGTTKTNSFGYVALVDGDGNVSAGGSSSGLTDAQLRATPVPVSGTVTTGGLTDAQLRATYLPVPGTEYETVAASQTAQVLGTTGATGDLFVGLLVIPATTAAGAVTILDNATSITVFAGGTGSVTSLVPFAIPLGIKSVSGAWKVTTGANVSVIAIGDFT